MEVLITLSAFVAFDLLVWWLGADSREGFHDDRYRKPALTVR